MERLGRYELLRKLGSGGTGVVWEAVLHGPGGFRKRVALKVLHDGTDQLRREARLGGLLRHRHLVDVYEVGEVDGRWFCALELCPGGSVRDLAPLPPRAVVDVGLQVCEALRYAHEELGLVHLDLKPDNLLVSGTDIKVADLGIARAEGFDGDGRIRGTPGYMAPEQARGDAVDARADVYALGVTLLELATGSRPGAAGTLDLSDEAPWEALGDDDGLEGFGDGPDRSDGMPAWLAPALDRCLEPHPDDRWPDLVSLAEALRALVVDGEGLVELLARRGADDLPEPDPVAQANAYVGREEELAALIALLSAPGVVIVRGPVGIGKSRGMAEAARRVAGERPTVLCELAEARSVDEVLFAVASGLDVPLTSGGPQARIDQLGWVIAGRGAVTILLDGFDRVADHAPLLERWTQLAPEACFVVGSLQSLPRFARDLTLRPLEAAEAQALLLVRALERGVSIEGDPHVPELAARLDGVPLALELAAGRLGVLSVADVLERLSLSLLRRSSDDRQGALRAALEASWLALDATLQAALGQLSIFSGGFTVEAAEGVLDLGGASVLDAVSALVDRSMVTPTTGGRLKLLAGVREYASEQEGDAPALAERHGRWFASLGRVGGDLALDGPGGPELRRLLLRDLDNLKDACRRAIDRSDGPAAAALVSSILAASDFRGAPEQVVPLGLRALELPLVDRHRLLVQRAVASALTFAGAYREALPHAEEALALSRVIGDTSGEATALVYLGTLYWDLGRVSESRASLAEGGRRLIRSSDARSRAAGLRYLGELALWEGRETEGFALLEQSLAGFRALGDRRSEAGVLVEFGRHHKIAGRLVEAAQCYEAALTAHRESGNRRGEGTVLANLGNVVSQMDREEEALTFYREAVKLHREVGNRAGEGVTHASRGAVLRVLGRPVEALAALETALHIARETGGARPEATARAGIARVLVELGRADEALPHFGFALDAYRRLGLDHLVAEVARDLENLGRADLLAGDTGPAGG